MTCKNVGFENIYTEDKNLNQRRINKGKIPFYETKVLTIDTHHEINNETEEIKFDVKSCKKQHLRRGHIRRLKKGVNIWVNACVVGSKKLGLINKTYKVK